MSTPLQAEQTTVDIVEQMDYVMTFQALYGLETTVKFFGKRGMLLHGKGSPLFDDNGCSDALLQSHRHELHEAGLENSPGSF